MHNQPNQQCEFNLEPAKKFFTEAIKLTQAFSGATYLVKPPTSVPVDSGECISIVLCDEYKGIRLQKFFAKKNTSMLLPDEGVCRGFIVHDGDMSVCYDSGRSQMRLPKDRHFFYVNDKEEIILEFFLDTWFYMVSMHS